MALMVNTFDVESGNYGAILNDDQIWRYMSFARMISMFSRSGVYFPSMELQEDKWEGVIPRCVLNWVESSPSVQSQLGSRSSYREHFRKVEIPRHFASCWHRNLYESAAMWHRYGPEAIAVVTSVGRLKSYLEKCSVIDESGQRHDHLPVKIGNVGYLDHRIWRTPAGCSPSPLEAFFYKRYSFSYEQEFRAVIDASALFRDPESHKPASALLVRANDISQLFELFGRIHVAPDAKDWFFEVVKSALGTYGYPDADTRVKRTDPMTDLYM